MAIVEALSQYEQITTKTSKSVISLCSLQRDFTVAEAEFFFFLIATVTVIFLLSCSPMMHKYCVFPVGDRVNIFFTIM